MEPAKDHPVNMPVDCFFTSLSQDLGANATGIILSGMASDGTMGIKAIKNQGGMTMVQQPDTAKYNGMPQSAVETGRIDFILPVEKMPETLIRYFRHDYPKLPGKIKSTDILNENLMGKIFALIRNATGHDFSHYKPSTITRRIERRLEVHQIESVSDYILYLQKNPFEINALFKNILIGVTAFFRDLQAYDVIEKEIFPDLLKNKGAGAKLRCWVPGCSTGEEAYSLAIILSEVMDKLKKYVPVRIFATDIEPSVIDIARRGIYPENVVAGISQDRLTRFFTKSQNGFRVKKQVRAMVVFSIQNLIKDPPFSRLDLVSCRNLMIYMDCVLQNKIIPLFHYTLNPGGVLFLGTYETINESMDLFEPVNLKWKIFRRKPSFKASQHDFRGIISSDTHQRTPYAEENKLTMTTDLQALVERAIIDAYAPSGVLINDKYEIVHFIGKTDKYLAPPVGKPSFNLGDMVREAFKNELMITIHKVVRGGKNTPGNNVKIKYNDGFHITDISVRPLTDKGRAFGLYLVMFEEKTPADMLEGEKNKPSGTNKKDEAIQRLEQELDSTREYLQSTIEELETSNEELQSANEELQSMNEELETSTEELQSTNEELSTVNSELQNKVDEYLKASDDMNNLLAATEIATIFLDTKLCIKNFTPAAASIINLIQTDIGRPLDDLKTCFADINLADLAGEVLKDLNTVELDSLSRDDIWYSIKIIPYRTTRDVIDGVVMTFINVHKIKQADKYKRLAAVLSDSSDAIIVLDMKGNILAWNRGAENMYGWTESEALKMNLRALLVDDKSNELESIVEKLEKSDSMLSFHAYRKTKNGMVIEVWMTLSALTYIKDRPVEIASTERNLAWLKEVQE